MTDTNIILNILNERVRQRTTYTSEHDKKHTREEWIELIITYLHHKDIYGIDTYKKRMIQVAALCVAAIQADYHD